MTRPKNESESAATSTIVADSFLDRRGALARKLIILAVFGAGVAWTAGPSARLLLLLPLLLFGPGYLIERTLLPTCPHTPLIRLSLWLGLSLSSIALLYEWVTVLGWALATPALALLAAACGAGVIWHSWRSTEPQARDRAALATRTAHVFPDLWSNLGLLIVLVLTLWMRFWQISDLALPSWVDSLHHALLIRVAAERGQAPLSLRPYMPLDQLPYHWGYHVFVATLLRLSGAPLPQTMLWTGQVLNALSALAAAALAAYIWRRPLAGTLAALVVGLLSIFPAYYVSWGRYTQLAGLLLLPALMIAWLALLRRPRRGPTLVLALLLAGLSLVHFIVLVFGLCFMAISGLAWSWRAQWPGLRARMLHALAGAALALALAGPWLWLLLQRLLLRKGGSQAPPLVSHGSYFALDPNLLWAGQNRLLIALALLGALWALRRRIWQAPVLIAWLGVLFVLANAWLLPYLLPELGVAFLLLGLAQRRRVLVLLSGALLVLNPLLLGRLPNLALVNNESILISLFLPISVLLGGGAHMLWEQLQRWMSDHTRLPKSWLSIAATACVLALVFWGAPQQAEIVNHSTILATAADLEAISWAAEHTPADARFLINAAGWLATGRGTDGGWWLLPLAGRWVSTPPVLYDYGPPDYVRATQARTQQVASFQAGQEQALYAMIDRDKITYVYLGNRSGALTAAAFPASAGFTKVYERGGISILAVHRS